MQYAGLLAALGVTLTGGLYAQRAWLDPPANRVALAAPVALARVARVEFPGRVQGMLEEAGNGTGSIDRTLVPGRSVAFAFRVNGQAVATYTVGASPSGTASSDLATAFVMAPDAAARMPGITIPMARQFAIVGRAMVEESVAAALAGRAYDRAVERRALQAYAMANMGEILGTARASMDQAAALGEPAPATRYVPPPVGVTFTPGQPMTRARPGY